MLRVCTVRVSCLQCIFSVSQLYIFRIISTVPASKNLFCFASYACFRKIDVIFNFVFSMWPLVSCMACISCDDLLQCKLLIVSDVVRCRRRISFDFFVLTTFPLFSHEISYKVNCAKTRFWLQLRFNDILLCESMRPWRGMSFIQCYSSSSCHVIHIRCRWSCFQICPSSIALISSSRVTFFDLHAPRLSKHFVSVTLLLFFLLS